MDIEKAFQNIQDNIKNEKYEAVRPEIDAIADASGNDPAILLKCASLLKVIDDESGCQSMIDLVLEKTPDNPKMMYDVGIAIRGMNRAEEAYELMKGRRDDPVCSSEIARTLLMMDEAEEALLIMDSIKDKTIGERILNTEILCSLGEFTAALNMASDIISEDTSYDSLICYCTVLLRTGRSKDAIKFAKSNMKEDKKNPDSLALTAYVMRINDKIPAAVNYSNRALQIDYSHVGALETMAMCLVEKSKFTHAKLLAGVINDKDPGNPAALRILDACRIASNF